METPNKGRNQVSPRIDSTVLHLRRTNITKVELISPRLLPCPVTSWTWVDRGRNRYFDILNGTASPTTWCFIIIMCLVRFLSTIVYYLTTPG